MIITIPFKTPTINHLYTQNRWTKQKCLTNEANKLKKEIKEIIDSCAKYVGIPGDTRLKVSIDIFENWECKDGSVKKKDIANREKFLVDAIFQALGIDDRYIFEHTMRKVQSEDIEKAVITIGVYNANPEG